MIMDYPEYNNADSRLSRLTLAAVVGFAWHGKTWLADCVADNTESVPLLGDKPDFVRLTDSLEPTPRQRLRNGSVRRSDILRLAFFSLRS